jgi:tRNA A37 threonylcarbamoyladenosine synthetase subunit TsaC/SUA5/YrdC
MSLVISPQKPVLGTGDPIAPEQLQQDVGQLLDCLYAGGVGIVPLDVAYAIVGSRESAIRRIFEAKNRSYEKPSGLLANVQMSDEIHLLEQHKRDIIREMIAEEKLPFSVVAPFDPNHVFFKQVDAFVLQNSTKAHTLDMLLNAGVIHDEIARQSWAAGQPVFGSSANTSLRGSKYRVQDIESSVREAADLIVDYGLSKYANAEGRSSTIIDFRDFSVIRIGVQFNRLRAAFKDRFGISLITPENH